LPQLFAVGAPALWSVNGTEKRIASDRGQIGDIASTDGADVVDERGAGAASIRPPELGVVGGAVLGTVIGAEDESAAQVRQVSGIAASAVPARRVDVLDQIGVGRGSVGGLPELRAVGATALWPVVGREEEGTSHVGQVAGIASSGGADVLDQVRVGVGSVGGHPQLSGVRAAALHPVEGGEEEGAADIGQLLGTA